MWAEEDEESVEGTSSDSGMEEGDMGHSNKNYNETCSLSCVLFNYRFANCVFTAPAGLFTTTSVSMAGRSRRTRQTFLEEICICGSNEKINLSSEEWKSDSNLIECQALGCETRVVSY